MNLSMGGGPSTELPWSHLDEDQFKRMRNEYGKYWAHYMHPTGGRVFKRLVFHVGYETGACFARRETLASKVRDKAGKPVDAKTISRYTTKYRELGIFDVVTAHEVVKRRDVGGRAPSPRLKDGNRTNRYIIDLDRYALLDDEGGFRAVSSRPTDLFVTHFNEVPLPRSHPKYRHFYPGIGPADLPDIPRDELPALLAKEINLRVGATTGTPGVDVARAEHAFGRGLEEFTPEEMLLSIIRFGDYSQMHSGDVWDAFMENHGEIMKNVEKALVKRRENGR
ncbi:hypothetical protein CcI49_27550 [Frankia sp. CcI49]|uniref:hypothetical protein n=1 Tax=Frankia sp. CcI49 TaxID=1745382 RepID=UPI0009753928|nr:hypothetical protein [Frankia sp. CcI49]ONH56215.1 hypothetical protein CcI49_27550 [Frankia sp. CcI49]